MAKAKRRRNRRTSVAVARRARRVRATSNRRHRRRANPTRVVVVSRKNRRSGHRRRRNPAFFGSSTSTTKMAQYVVGGMLGMGINRLIMPLLPDQIKNNNLYASIAAFAVAAGEWYVAALLIKDANFAASVGFGGMIQAGSQALNTFVPQVASRVGLSGYRGRGMGELIPGNFVVPQNPVLGAAGSMASGNLLNAAYPAAYAA